MPKKSYSNSKGRRESGGFVALPYCCLDHENYTRLSTKAIKLLLDFCRQYNGFNNGDLTVAFSVLKERGWKSKETLFLAKEELIHYGWITCTHVGMSIRTPNLYALTFHNIDECKGKLDVNPTSSSAGTWKQKVNKWQTPEKYRNRFKR